MKTTKRPGPLRCPALEPGFEDNQGPQGAGVVGPPGAVLSQEALDRSRIEDLLAFQTLGRQQTIHLRAEAAVDPLRHRDAQAALLAPDHPAR